MAVRISILGNIELEMEDKNGKWHGCNRVVAYSGVGTVAYTLLNLQREVNARASFLRKTYKRLKLSHTSRIRMRFIPYNPEKLRVVCEARSMELKLTHGINFDYA